ncbi:MAG: YitT family protein [Ginsengibacter sp.]
MQFDKACSFLINKLEAELPKYLTYHDVTHTKDVIEHVTELATTEGVEEPDLTMLKTAALFHECGMLETYKGHEDISCKMAKKWLPDFEYTNDEIEKICSLIMATKMPQAPVNLLQQIICDADLYYLGTDSYVTKANKLYKELHEAGIIKDRARWQTIEVEFLQSQHYFTESANKKLNTRLKQNVQGLKNNKHISKNQLIGFSTKGWLADLIFMITGAFLAAFALKGFLVPNNFFDGGVTGISLLIHEIYYLNLTYVIIIANIPFIIMCIYAVNLKYALKTLLCIILLGVCLLIPFYQMTQDKLLISIFGGFFLGIGTGLAMRAGCAIDGIEVLALYTWKKTSFTITEIILAINIVIFSIAAFKFGIDTALYSVLTYFTVSKTIDYVVEGLEAYIGVTIISGKSEIIKDRLVNEMGRGITVYKGERGYLPGQFEMHQDVDIIFTVVTRLELRKLKNLVHEIDGRAFIFASMIREASGGIIKRRHVH